MKTHRFATLAALLLLAASGVHGRIRSVDKVRVVDNRKKRKAMLLDARNKRMKVLRVHRVPRRPTVDARRRRLEYGRNEPR